MLRWLLRLLIIGLIIGAIAYAVSRFLGQDEDFDDFEDTEEGFEFQETPVEIDVPASSVAARTTDGGPADQGGAESSADTAGAAGASATAASATATLEPAGTGADAQGEVATQGDTDLTVINGIGSAFDARLKAIGINTLQDLANADPQELSERLDVIGGPTTLEDWITQAKNLTQAQSGS